MQYALLRCKWKGSRLFVVRNGRLRLEAPGLVLLEPPVRARMETDEHLKEELACEELVWTSMPWRWEYAVEDVGL